METLDVRKSRAQKRVYRTDEKGEPRLEGPDLLEIEQKYLKYIKLNDDGTVIDQFTCPVDGCDFETDQSPGALRMHMIIKADPKITGRYCPRHEGFYRSHQDELTLRGVSYIARFPSKLHLDTMIGNVKE
jgi:hypothetical protein